MNGRPSPGVLSLDISTYYIAHGSTFSLRSFTAAVFFPSQNTEHRTNLLHVQLPPFAFLTRLSCRELGWRVYYCETDVAFKNGPALSIHVMVMVKPRESRKTKNVSWKLGIGAAPIISSSPHTHTRTLYVTRQCWFTRSAYRSRGSRD